MNKNYLRSIIIVLIQTLLPIIALFLLTPWFLNTNLLSKIQYYLNTNQQWFLLWHAALYIGLIISWPHIIHRLNHKRAIPLRQMNSLINARWYLVATLVSIDLLILFK